LAFDALTLTPLQPESLVRSYRHYWLERGVQRRGGGAPSQKLSHSQTLFKWNSKTNLFERGIKGVSERTTRCK
jgi:hypothetical protein